MSIKAKLITWGIVLLVAIAVFLLWLFIKADYSVRGFSDAFFLPGATVLGLLVLHLTTRGGVFDFAKYSFVRIGDFAKRSGKKSYADAYEYSENQRAKRERNPAYIWPFIIIGGLLIITAVILMIVSNSIVY